MPGYTHVIFESKEHCKRRYARIVLDRHSEEETYIRKEAHFVESWHYSPSLKQFDKT